MTTTINPLLTRQFPRSLFWLILVTTLIELVLTLADLGLFGGSFWRVRLYEYGAFWAGLLHDWQPNYSVQPVTMFLTYAFLHGGLGHLIGNMLALWGLGKIVIDHFGSRGFIAIYILSAVGGGICFGILTLSPIPMVGASGALFGLAGAWQYIRWVTRREQGRNPWPVLITLVWLVVLNFLFWVLLDGLLAWETHLGGFIAGGAAAIVLARLKNRVS